tara:strand:+ start:8198 stop:9154 length:957 start_codon:yes stop_codon:yes gene_type:complete
MSKVKVGLIGHGHLGKWHAQKIEVHDETEFSSIIEINETQWAEIKNLYPNVQIFKTVEESFEYCDAYIVSSPTAFHYEIVIKLLKAKKHVFCEKPLVSTLDQAKEVNQLAKENKAILQVGHSERCHQIWERLGEFKDFLNQPSLINIERVAPFKGRATDVDVVQDLMIHDIDLLLYIFKKEPIALEAFGEKIRTKYWDYVKSIWYFDDGMKATITVGRNNISEVRNLEVISKNGMIQFDLMNREVKIADKNKESVEIIAKYEARDHLAIEQNYFYQSILKDRPVFVNGDDGVKSILYIEKVLESLDKKEKVLCHNETA